MIDIKAKIHDKFSVEFKVGFVADGERGNDFAINTWIFLPNSLDINPAMPSFAYLIPVMILLSIDRVPDLIAAVIRHINLLVGPTAGEIVIDGPNMADMSSGELSEVHRRDTAIQFQIRTADPPHRAEQHRLRVGLSPI